MTNTFNNTSTIEDNTAAPKAITRARMTRAEFCELEGISLSTYHKLRHAGHGPEERFLRGTRIVHITAKAHSDWCKAMEKWNKSKDAKLEASRRLYLAQQAGVKSVASRKAARAAAKQAAARPKLKRRPTLKQR